MYNIAAIGAGVVTNLHARAIEECENAKLVAVCDTVLEKAQDYASRFSCNAYDDFDAMITKEKIDVAIICLPVFLHAEYAQRCAQAGIHVLCEKPMEMDQAQARKILEARDRYGVKMMVAHCVRFWPGYADLKEMLSRGELGDVLMATFSRASMVPARGGWILDPERGRGAIQDMLIHDVDFLNHLFGKGESVFANAVRDDTGCFNHVMANIKFKNGIHATAQAAFTMKNNSYPFNTHFRVCGTKATVEYRYQASVLDIQAASRANMMICRPGVPVEIREVEEYNAYTRQLQYFLDCIEKDVQPEMNPLESSLDSICLLDAIRRSAESEQIERI